MFSNLACLSLVTLAYLENSLKTKRAALCYHFKLLNICHGVWRPYYEICTFNYWSDVTEACYIALLQIHAMWSDQERLQLMVMHAKVFSRCHFLYDVVIKLVYRVDGGPFVGNFLTY